jgi:hypothetical protein
LYVQRPASLAESKHQTAWAILIVWVVFDDFGIGNSFAEFLDWNPPKDALINSMLGELEQALCDLRTNILSHNRGSSYTSFPPRKIGLLPNQAEK